MTAGGKNRNEISSSRKISTTAGAIRPSKILDFELVEDSDIGKLNLHPLELEVEKWRLLPAIHKYHAHRQQDSQRASWNQTPFMPHLKGIRPKMGQAACNEEENDKRSPGIHVNTRLP